ncbi:MAG: ASCH domain-containing protein [Planctomycetota bacterium]|nr:MAG: ASCH domain-containing protein [Planctomycetota bacterium]
MLLFKKRFLELIRQGKKTQTIRLWKHRRMRAGQRSYIPGVGYIRIDAVDQVSPAELTDEDAHRDGFDSVDKLRAEIERLYPGEAAAGRGVYRVRFTVLPPDEQQRLREQRQRRKNAKTAD